ncbi:MAG: tetratricopeptide repeat protein [Chitinophagaceae bacterium]
MLIRSSLNNIGTINFYQGKMNEAEKAYQKTLALSQELADTANMILSYNNLGEVSLEQNNPAKALRYLTMAYNLALIKHVPDMLVAVTNTLGDTYYRLDSSWKPSAILLQHCVYQKNWAMQERPVKRF